MSCSKGSPGASSDSTTETVSPLSTDPCYSNKKPVEEVKLNVVANAALNDLLVENNLELPKVGAKLMHDNRCPVQKTFQGSHGQKYDKQMPTESSKCLLDGPLLQFP